MLPSTRPPKRKLESNFQSTVSEGWRPAKRQAPYVSMGAGSPPVTFPTHEHPLCNFPQQPLHPLPAPFHTPTPFQTTWNSVYPRTQSFAAPTAHPETMADIGNVLSASSITSAGPSRPRPRKALAQGSTFAGWEYRCFWGKCRVTYEVGDFSTRNEFEIAAFNHAKGHVELGQLGEDRMMKCAWWKCVDDHWQHAHTEACTCTKVVKLRSDRDMIRHIYTHQDVSHDCPCGASYSRNDQLKKHRKRCTFANENGGGSGMEVKQ
jgi:hypothetical protein